MDSAHNGDVDPEEGSDASFNSIDNAEDVKTQRHLDQCKTDNMEGLRSYTPLQRCMSSSGTEALDVLSEA